jgi:hypothetical protein
MDDDVAGADTALDEALIAALEPSTEESMDENPAT